MRGDRDRDGRVDARQLLDRDRVGDGVPSGAAVLLGDGQPHEPELRELGDELVGEAALEVELGGDGRDALPRERSHGVADELLLGREVEVHAAPILVTVGSARLARRGGARTMASVREFFEGLPERVPAERIAGMNNTYVFDIEGAGTWRVAIADGSIDVSEGEGDADVDVLLQRGELREDRVGRAEPHDRLHDREAQDQGRHGRGHEAPEAVLSASFVRRR